MKLLLLITILAAICLNGVYSVEMRNKTVSYNPGCDIDDCKKATQLVYIKASGMADALHVLYSNIGAFTIMMFKTDLDSNININWTNLLSNNNETMFNSIQFTKQPNESCAYVIPKIYEFNDLAGSADLTKIPNNATFWNVRNTGNMEWTFMNSSAENTIGMFKSVDAASNGTFSFQIRYYGEEKRDSSLPHLQVSMDATSIDFIVDSVAPTFKESKFGINIFAANNLESIQLKNFKSLDDEYTPGTFQIFTVEASDSDMHVQNYFQWKPIFYFYETLTLENSTETVQYNLGSNRTLPISLASAFFNSTLPNYTEFNISFGIAGNDKDAYFYPQSNYSLWTFTVGIGEPSVEKMSSIVTLLIFIGFGLPALVIVVGTLALLIKKCKNSHRSGYESM